MTSDDFVTCDDEHCDDSIWPCGKFCCFAGMLGTERPNLGSVISEGRSCDLENFSRTRLFGK